MSGPLQADEAIDLLIKDSSKYQTPETLRALARQVSVESPGQVTVLYSGRVADRVSAWNIVKAMEEAGEDVRLIDRTEINSFLNSREFTRAAAVAHGVTVDDMRRGDPIAKAANDWLYHPTDGPWADASARFADATRGEVKVIASGAAPDRVFAQTELPRILANPEVTTIEGIPRETLAARQSTHGTQAAFEMIVARSHENVGVIRSAVNAQGMPLRGDTGQLQLDNREYFRSTEIEGRTPSFPDSTRPMADLMGPPNAHALAGQQHLDELTQAAAHTQRPGSTGLRRAGSALGVAGLALEIYDGADSVRTAQRLHGEGNATAAESELIHFGARSVGGWAGAGIGMATGAVAGVESGPGLLVTGAIGGVAGVFVGDKIAEWTDNRRIYNQELGGQSWSYDPDKPSEGWRRRAPIDSTDDNIDNARRGDLRASPATENALNYQATSRSVELVLGGPPAQRKPFSLAAEAGDAPSSQPSNWERDPESGKWERKVYGPFVERGGTPYSTETADDARAERLDRQAAQIVVENAANSPASIAARYEDAYIRNGWQAYGEMPEAVRNARTNIDKLVSSEGDLYQRQANGRWVSDGMVYDSTASGRLHDELEATREVLQARLPPPREIPPVPPMDADARLRDTVAGAYRNAGVDASAEQVAAAAVAVRATWDANGLDPATTALQARPQADGRYELASLRLDADGKTYAIAAVTSPEEIERARTRAEIAPHVIERPSEQERDTRVQAQREANLQGLSQDGSVQAVATTMRMAGAGRRDDGAHELETRHDDKRQAPSANDRVESVAASTLALPARLPDPRDPNHPDHRLYQQIECGVAGIDAERGRTFDATSERLAMGAFHDAKAAGITSADHIAINETGKRQQDGSQVAAGTLLFVVQGQDPSDPAARRSMTDVAQAVDRPVEQSLQKVDTLAQQQAQMLAQAQNNPTPDDPGPKGPRMV
jgi:hypothetical protein